MKKLMMLALMFVQVAVALAQLHPFGGITYREIQYPLTENDTRPLFYYFNDEWIPGVDAGMVAIDRVLSSEIKNDEYGNRAIYMTVTPETLEQLKVAGNETVARMSDAFAPICEFPGGNGKLKDWIEENIRIPEGFDGNTRVLVGVMVMPDGRLSDPEIISVIPKDNNGEIAAEAIRLVNELPPFRVKYLSPRKEPVAVAIPVNFRTPGTLLIR
ncbi:MAG: TonB C-terminal domain-containing protein [Odoribacter sp.]|nr:TonB C-terminal domain-containing protein [Odoribacter sp.]